MDKIKENWIMFPLTLVCMGLFYKVYEQSVLEHHFIIPSTQWLPPALLAGNLVYYGLKGKKWARIVNFWASVCLWVLGFFSLFYSPTLAKTYAGPVWAGIFVAILVLIFGYLLYSYQKSHELFKD